MQKSIQFASQKDRSFFVTLRKRVDEYFQSTGQSRHANGAMIFKIIVLFSVLWGAYFSLLLLPLPGWAMLTLACLIGFTSALIGLNVCHDAIHGSLFKSDKWNKFFGLTFNLVGANMYVWSITHNQMHHTYTNIPEADEDLNAAPGVRTSPILKRRWIHRFQHIYAFLFYGLATISWVFVKDYRKMFQEKLGTKGRAKHPMIEYVTLFAFKLVYYAIFVVTPAIVLDVSWGWFIGGFLLSHWVEGITLALIFQLAHIVEGPQFPLPDADGKVEDNWAVHQLRTTANFSRKSYVAFWLCGGLNFQVEHHLFPNICHIHFRDISLIVKNTAEEFGFPYFENRTFIGAIGSHIRMLKAYGRYDDVTEVFKGWHDEQLVRQAS
jgi:linoleoyl-CoA desaturase